MRITFKFLGTGYHYYYQAKVKIYDSNNKLLYNGYSYNGIVRLNLKRKNAYRIEASLFNHCLIIPIYIFHEDTYVFNLIPNNNDKTITFLLTDNHYDNLPIMKGEILLG